MSWELALQIIQTAAVVIGVVFGLVQLRQLRTQREVQAGIELLQPAPGARDGRGDHAGVQLAG